MAMKDFWKMRENYFASTGNARKDAMMRLMQQITLLLRISAAPDTVVEYQGGLPTKVRRVVELAGQFKNEIVAIPLLVHHMAAVGAEQHTGEQPHLVIAVRAFALLA